MSRKHNQHGFTIIEMMVGVVVGLLASLVILNVFALSEREKRTTTGAADAQTNGAIALYMMERDIKMAGWGLESTVFKDCSTIYSFYDDGVAPAAPVNDLFASVIITNGGTAPDEIAIQFYSNPAEKDFKFSLTTLRETMPSPSAELKVSSTYGCEEGDLAIVQQGSNCTLMEITQVQDASLKLQHNSGGTPTYNPGVPYMADNGWPAYTTSANLQCFSKLYKRTYRASAHSLELLEPDSADVMQTYRIAPEIMDVQAQYGIANVGAQDISSWVEPTGAWAHDTITVANMRRIKALRIALVARSAQFEKPDEDGNCTATSDGMVAGWSSWANFDTSGYPADWKCYRYKVFETVVPLTNIIWAKL